MSEGIVLVGACIHVVVYYIAAESEPELPASRYVCLYVCMYVCMYVCISISMFIFVIGGNQIKTVSVCLYGHGHSDFVIVRSHPVSGP